MFWWRVARLFQCGTVHTVTPSPSPTSTRTPIRCVGDCDGDGRVTVSEIVRGVGIALGTTAIRACTALDRNADREVSVFELISAVGSALGACPPPLTATATPSASGTTTATPTPSATGTATITATATATVTATGTPTISSTATVTLTFSPTRSPRATDTPTASPTATPPASALVLELADAGRGANADGTYTIVITALASDALGHPVGDGAEVAFGLDPAIPGAVINPSAETNRAVRCDVEAFERDTGRVLAPQPGLTFACVRYLRRLEGAETTVRAAVRGDGDDVRAALPIVLPIAPNPAPTPA